MNKETIDRILEFTKERNWSGFHNPKDLAISINLEASELLEIFQWSGEDLSCLDKKDRIAEELSDVLNYCVLLASVCNLDIDKIMNDKIDMNAIKYPVE